MLLTSRSSRIFSTPSSPSILTDLFSTHPVLPLLLHRRNLELLVRRNNNRDLAHLRLRRPLLRLVHPRLGNLLHRDLSSLLRGQEREVLHALELHGHAGKLPLSRRRVEREADSFLSLEHLHYRSIWKGETAGDVWSGGIAWESGEQVSSSFLLSSRVELIKHSLSFPRSSSNSSSDFLSTFSPSFTPT